MRPPCSCGIGMLDRIDAIRCGAPMRLPLRSTASPCHAPRRRPAMLPRLFCARRPVRLVLHGKVAPLRGCASVVPLLRSTGSPPLCSTEAPPFRSTGCLRFAPRGHLHSAPRGHLHSAPRGHLHSAPRGCLRFAPRVGSTSLHRCDDARKTADLRHRSPSPGGELQQKCEAMGTVALHPGFPLMRMIFFDKTPPWDPCLWGEVE